MEGFRICTDVAQMDLDAVHEFLANSYWARGLPLETFRRATENSLCFGVLSPSNTQVAFARVITDSATYAYLADVFVIAEYRKRGISKWLLQEILEHSQLQGLRRIMLATRDAHELYRQQGFSELASPQIFMERWNPDVYVGT